jgi:hypothetical protein
MGLCANDAALNNKEIARMAKVLKICWTLQCISLLPRDEASIRLITEQGLAERRCQVVEGRTSPSF